MTKKIKNKYIESIYKWLLWITNNEDNPKHEIEFDIGFFIANTICLVAGSIIFIVTKEYGWIAVLVIEYTWALDNMRHNRA